jgi:cytochrome b6
MHSIAFILRRLSTILAVALLTLTLIGASSGVLLAFYYQPIAGGAHDSLKLIDETIPYGWLVHTLHSLSGNLMIGLGLIQIVVMFLGERFRRNWLTAWISGILFTLSAIALSWTAMILNWDQIGFWRLKVELGTIEAIPFIGPVLRDILTGGALGSETVAHFYTLHSYVISIGAVVLSIVHLVGLLFQEKDIQEELQLAAVQPQPNPNPVEPSTPPDNASEAQVTA